MRTILPNNSCTILLILLSQFILYSQIKPDDFFINSDKIFYPTNLSIKGSDLFTQTNTNELILPENPNNAAKLLRSWFDQNWKEGSWVNFQKLIYSYVAKNSVIKTKGLIYQRWFGNWDNYWQSHNTYDSLFYLIEDYYETWSGGNWENSSKSIYKNNILGLADTIINKTWSSAFWLNSSKQEILYTTNNKILSSILKNWSGSDWTNLQKVDYEYNLNNELNKKTVSKWTAIGWEYTERELISYIAPDRVQEDLYLAYNSSKSKWDTLYRAIYSYLGNTKEEIFQNWDKYGYEWLNSRRWLSIYKDQELKYLLNSTSQWWDSNQSLWNDDGLITCTYDKENYLQEELAQIYQGTELVNSYRRFYSYGSIIEKPMENDIFIAGEKDTIKWLDNLEGITIKIEYSDDDEVTYNTVAEGISGDSCKYVWDVPDSIVSKKCSVKLIESSTSADIAVSDKFGIRPYILTKTDSTTDDFVVYDINKDRWGFKNDSADVWPDWWYDRFNNYTGDDPFTGKPYIGSNADSLFASSWGYQFPDWESFVWAFSPSVCYYSLSQGIYSLTAVKRWTDNYGEWGGSCFGIAGTNALAFMQRDKFKNKFKDFPDFTDPITVKSDSNVIPVVAEIFSHQFGKPTSQNIDNSINKTANETLHDLKAMLRKSDEVRMLIIINQHGDGAHGILPYKLEKDKSNGSIYYVYVYDNSHSDITDAKIKIDTTAYGNTGSWEPLYGWANWGGNKGMFLEVISDEYLNNALLYKKNLSRSVFVLDPDKLEVLTPRGNDIIIKNSSQQTIGYQNNQILQDIPNAYAMRIINGSEIPPYGYSLPNDLYTIEASNFTKPKASANIYTGNKIFTVTRNGAVNNQKDDIHYWSDQRIVLNNPAGEVDKTFKISEIINEITQEKMYIVRNISMNENDSFEMMNTETDKLKLTNNGSEKNYEIELQYVDENKYDRFLHKQISLPFLSNHIISPDWSDIKNVTVTILVDIANNGTIDDTIHLDNQITDINEEQGSLIPTEYRLEQNYPNPFNPTTKISYAIPQNSFVELKVFNLLGQEIATLVNQEKPAGTYEAIFDASNLSSGVYIYKMKAGKYVSTRKMVLLK